MDTLSFLLVFSIYLLPLSAQRPEALAIESWVSSSSALQTLSISNRDVDPEPRMRSRQIKALPTLPLLVAAPAFKG